MWIGDRLQTKSLPKFIREQQVESDGSDYFPDFVLTSSVETEPINLIEYCTNIANVKSTYVTCILANQDWY